MFKAVRPTGPLGIVSQHTDLHHANADYQGRQGGPKQSWNDKGQAESAEKYRET